LIDTRATQPARAMFFTLGAFANLGMAVSEIWKNL
jgi:hypothetical protein